MCVLKGNAIFSTTGRAASGSILLLLSGLIAFYLLFAPGALFSDFSRARSSIAVNHYWDTPPESPVCPNLPGVDDIYVILKTGAAVALERLPIHFTTTLQCIPDYVIYSDLEEIIATNRVHDALKDVPTDLLDKHAEFDIYRRLKTLGRSGVDIGHDEANSTGRDAIGWKLDKWKFLPILEKAWQDRPSAKWYVFMEDDTYISWPNLLQYLTRLDPDKPFYAGAQMQIGETIFAHGGSGFVISHEAMRLAVEKRRDNLQYYDDLTEREWAGDCVLGALLRDVGADVFWAWPNFQGESTATMNFSAQNYGQSVWCKAALTFHHMKPQQIQELWEFEKRFAMTNDGRSWTYADLYEQMSEPNIKARGPSAVEWDNMSEGRSIELFSNDKDAPLTRCRILCEEDIECVQYRVRNDMKTCETSKRVLLGHAAKGVKSGWVNERLDGFRERLGSCAEAEWVLPQTNHEGG